jgi:MarR family transcriptional regulator, negative regulator of the multidrug operon emrRAB
MGHAANVVGAGVLALAEVLRDATERAADHGSSAPAALAALETYLDGSSIDELRRVLGITHSGAVRLVDRLEAGGLLRRTVVGDARARGLVLTPAGRRAAQRVLDDRAAALAMALAPLSAAEQEQLGTLLGRVVGGLTDGRAAARRICRLCDPVACGHDEGRCPVTQAADAAAVA